MGQSSNNSPLSRIEGLELLEQALSLSERGEDPQPALSEQPRQLAIFEPNRIVFPPPWEQLLACVEHRALPRMPNGRLWRQGLRDAIQRRGPLFGCPEPRWSDDDLEEEN